MTLHFGVVPLMEQSLLSFRTHRPIDLLPDRSAAALAAWLKEHPGVQWMSRDRSQEYARGASAGAPEARQIVDRWHLLKTGVRSSNGL